MTDGGVVFDLGYRPHEGPRQGRRAVVWAVIRDGLRRVLGLRRRARRKVLPWGLIAVAMLPVLFFVAIGVVIGELAEEAELFGHAQYFDLTGAIALVFIALAGAELLVPDRENGTLAVYASRPLTTLDYLSARTAALAILVLGFLYLPHIVLYLGEAWVSSEGFGSYLGGHAEDLWQSALASLAYFAAFAPIGMVVAAVASRTAVAAGTLIGIVTISGPASAGLVDSGIDMGGLLALQHHPGVVKDWIMDANTHRWIPERAGLDPIASVVVIAVIVIASAWFVMGRYRRLT
jgi:ABC-2 type transport system permease protein